MIEIPDTRTDAHTAMDKFLTILSTGISKAMIGESKFVFQCGRYKAGDFIEPHDDMATKDINGELHARSVAFVLHLSRDWSLDKGGIFLDHGCVPSMPMVPKFNTLVFFKVPRLHEVTPVSGTCDDHRFSIFGWSLVPVKGANKNTLKKKKKKKKSKGKGKVKGMGKTEHA